MSSVDSGSYCIYFFHFLLSSPLLSSPLKFFAFLFLFPLFDLFILLDVPLLRLAAIKNKNINNNKYWCLSIRINTFHHQLYRAWVIVTSAFKKRGKIFISQHFLRKKRENFSFGSKAETGDSKTKLVRRWAKRIAGSGVRRNFES